MQIKKALNFLFEEVNMKIIISVIALCIFMIRITCAMSSSQELAWAIDNKHPNKNIQQIIQENRANAKILYEQFLQEMNMTPLSYAAEKRKWQVVLFFVMEKIDPNYLSTQGNLPLCTACYNLQPAVVNQLLKSGAKINGVDAFGKTALHALVTADDVNFCNTPIQFALSKNLLKLGAQINLQDSEGNTPLHDLIKKYLYLKLRVNIGERKRIESSFNKLVKLFLYFGAKYDLKNKHEETALTMSTQDVSTFLTTKRSELFTTMTQLMIRAGLHKDIAQLIIQERYK
jgi:ankyrin repeat protein